MNHSRTAELTIFVVLFVVIAYAKFWAAPRIPTWAIVPGLVGVAAIRIALGARRRS